MLEEVFYGPFPPRR